jgi:hypothetical protein
MFSFNIKKLLKSTWLFAALFVPVLSPATEIRSIDASSDVSIEVRIFPAKGDQLLLGFPCDEGSSIAEESTAISLAQDGIEVWMPDILSALMLPKVRSSISKIPTPAIERLIDAALRTGKKVYLIASGPDTDLVLRSAANWEQQHASKPSLAGAVLLFPRLNKGAPEPGKEPEYLDSVGKTNLPILLLEGERTPNRWGLDHLTHALEKGGSPVITKVIPEVRGYFFKRQDPNMPEEVVTSQLSGLIKASLFQLGSQP